MGAPAFWRARSWRQSRGGGGARRVRESDGCGRLIAYVLERESPVRRSVPTIEEIPGEQDRTRFPSRKNRPRGVVPMGVLSPGGYSKWIG